MTIRFNAVFFLTLSLIVCMALRLLLTFVYEINWDEFLNLGMVYSFERGDLNESPVTGFVHGFRWLKYVSYNEVDQVIAARLVMFVLASLTLIFIVATARRFMPLYAALFAGLCFAVYTYTVRQGTSFRADTMAAGVLMPAVWIVATRPYKWQWAVLAGGLIGLSGMLTIKAIFYTPIIAALLMLNLAVPGPKAAAFRHGLIVAFTGLASFCLIFAAHWITLSDPVSIFAFLERVTGATLGFEGNHVLPRYFVPGLVDNPVFWISLILGLMTIGWRIAKARERIDAMKLLCFGFTLTTLLFYSESYPYYYPFILPPVAVLCGVGLAALNAKTGKRLALIGATAVVLKFGFNYSDVLRQHNRAQHQVVDVVHQMFPEPVAYIDRTSMVSSFPKKGFFLSVWGMLDYYNAGQPVIAEAIREDQPKFVLANRFMLEFENLVPERAGPEHYGFFLPDIVALRETYIPRWGKIYVAGKELLIDPGEVQRFEVQIEGPYTIEASAPVTLNGEAFKPGSHVNLSAGEHSLTADVAGNVTLRWGVDLYRPDFDPPGRLFTRF